MHTQKKKKTGYRMYAIDKDVISAVAEREIWIWFFNIVHAVQHYLRVYSCDILRAYYTYTTEVL